MAPTSTENGAVPGDVLGPPYVARTLHLRPDEEGAVVATLVHRPADGPPTGKAVLHVHGFCDYFFQTAAADFWCNRGYDFYALDLRKYGRSLLPHQTPNFVTELATYHEELDLAYEAISANYRHIVLSAHSTGGLIVPLWVSDRRLAIAGMVLNSPWLDMHGDVLTRKVAMPAIQRFGTRKPNVMIPRNVSGYYGRSIHVDHDGEWDFNLAWKPLESWPVYTGWIAAIRQGQARVAAGSTSRRRCWCSPRHAPVRPRPRSTRWCTPPTSCSTSTRSGAAHRCWASTSRSPRSMARSTTSRCRARRSARSSSSRSGPFSRRTWTVSTTVAP